MANNYSVNYDDKRFAEVNTDKNQALTELEQTYGGMINESDKYYQAQIDASKQWADKQSQLQQEKTDFTIEQIEQQKDKAQKDYTKEQSGAYVDWRKQSNEYGTEAEKMASAGLSDTGFSESSQVSMYNTYQNRVATAREAFIQANLNYDNAIKDARLQNNSVLAEIAYEAYIKQAELALQGFQYKNQLILEQANKKTEVENIYYNRYLDVLKQINTENALAEEVRQYNESLAQEKAKLAEQKRQFDAQMSAKKSSSSGGSSSAKKSSGSGSNKKSSGSSTSKKTHGGSSGTWGTSKNNSDLVIVNSPLTVQGAAERVARGELTAKQVGNKVYLSNNPNYIKGQNLLDEYTSFIKRK